MLRRGQWARAAHFLPGAAAHAGMRRSRLLLSALRQAATGRSRVEAPPRRPAWMAPAFHAAHAPKDEVWLDTGRHAAALPELIEYQLTRALGTSTLLYEYRNAAAAGIGLRQPYLAASFWALSRACADEDLVSDSGQSKRILRSALAGRAPAEALSRPQRVGFAVPAMPWLRANPAWLAECVGELGGIAAWGGPGPAAVRSALEGPPPQAWATAAQAWRWIALLEWARSHDLRID